MNGRRSLRVGSVLSALALLAGAVVGAPPASASVAKPSWPQAGFDAGGSNFNPRETTINAGNVMRLVPQWSAGNGSFVIAAGTLFSTTSGLAAFRIARCARRPAACAPVWTAKGQYDDLAFAGDVVFAATVNQQGNAGVAAFDASGTSNCAGTPKVCKPLWTWFDVPATGSSSVGNLKVGNGLLWVRDEVFENQSAISSNVRAFDITHQTGCGGHACNPVRSIATAISGFTYTLGPQQVIVADPGGMTVYDARTGTEEWQSLTTGYDSNVVVAGHTIYAAATSTLRVEGYPTSGGPSCSGSPRSCPPAFLVPFAGSFVPSLAATPSVLFVNDGSDIRSYDAAGTTNCFGASHLCQPLYTYPNAGGDVAPVVANGVLYSNNRSSLNAYDATGASGCDQATHTCGSLWTMTPQRSSPSALEVTGGALYATSQADGHIHAFVLAAP